jgi:hypothetical protein
MASYSRPHTSAAPDQFVNVPLISISASNQEQSSFDPKIAYDDNFQYESGAPHGDYWCPSCGLSYSDCLCYSTSPISSYQDYPSYDTQQSKNYTNSQATYPPMYTTSNSSSPSAYYATSTPVTPQPSYSTIPSTTNSNKKSHTSTPEPSSKRGKRKGSMPPDEAREKRLEQNRRSQRSFRDRQAKLVTELKQKVEVLTEENQKLANELSIWRDSSARDSRSPGDYSNY